MNIIKNLTAVFIILAFTLNAEARLKTLTVQIRWLHQFQFAGYYAALEKEYYQDAGNGKTF